VKQGDLIHIKGNDPDWLDMRVKDFPNWVGLVVGKDTDALGRVKVMKGDGEIFLVVSHRIIGVVDK
jgi:hypothetical protein